MADAGRLDADQHLRAGRLRRLDVDFRERLIELGDPITLPV